MLTVSKREECVRGIKTAQWDIACRNCQTMHRLDYIKCNAPQKPKTDEDEESEKAGPEEEPYRGPEVRIYERVEEEPEEKPFRVPWDRNKPKPRTRAVGPATAGKIKPRVSKDERDK